MISVFATNKIKLNYGYLDIIKSARPYPSLTYKKEENSGLIINYLKSSITNIVVRDNIKHYVNFYLDISVLNDCYIKVGIGATEIDSVTPKVFINTIGSGSIVVNIKETDIGSLYMKVTTGTIISNCAKLKITPLIDPPYSHGAEAYFEGKLKGQRTELLLGTGAIVCNIIN